MYRFAFTPRWLGGALGTVALATIMILLGNWQLHRYHQRAEVNARIDASATTEPAPLQRVLPAPGRGPGTAGRPPAASVGWARVSAAGHFDQAHQILARGRTVEGRVGFEVVTPLVLDDGAAVLVDRGWLPAPPGDATALPAVPAPSPGRITITGRVHLSESRPGPLDHRGGFIDVRRIAVAQLAPQLPYPVYGAYLLSDPPAGTSLRSVPIEHENAWQNAAYVVQWWLMSGMTLVAFGWLVRREALSRKTPDRDTPDREGPDRETPDRKAPDWEALNRHVEGTV